MEGNSISVSLMNTFTRKYDLIFLEMGRVDGREVYWFTDKDKERRHYTCEEIADKLMTDGVI